MNYFISKRLSSLSARRAAALLALGAASLGYANSAFAQSCPIGSYCYYAPPILSAPQVSPDGYSTDIVLSSPAGTITGSIAVNGGAPQPFSVTSGTPVNILMGPTDNKISGFLVAEERGAFIVASSSDLVVDQRLTATYWQSSSTVKSNVIGLGTRFRAGGYSLNADNGDGTGYDFISVYAPSAATITVEAPPGAAAPFWNDGIPGLTHSFSLQQGQTYLLRSVTGADIDGALITSDQPISVAIGGRGWWPGGCGDDGMDHLIPTSLLGTQYVVDDYPASSTETVRVVADTDGTTVSVDGVLVATLNQGEYFQPAVSGVAFIETSQPAYVFQSAGEYLCEFDVAMIPPISFAPMSINISFNVIGFGTANIIIPTAEAGTILLDGMPPAAPSVVPVPTHPEWSRVRFPVAGGDHSISAQSDFQLGMVSATGGGGTGLFAYFNPYRLPGCGDGMIGASEGCDDANITDGDGCSSTCQVEPGYQCMNAPSVCSVIDTDNDGIGDYIEVAIGYDPNNADADGDGVLDPSDLDLDNDGIPNTVECNAATLSLVNGSFELPDFANGSVNYPNESAVPGWDTTASDNIMEFWGTGFLGVPSADGNQFVELNANEVSTLFQDVATTPGQVYFYRFYHRGRSGPETMTFYVGDPASALVKQREVTTDTTAWQLVTGVYTVPAGQTMSRFAFESTMGGAAGNFLDGVAFTPGCSVDTDSDGTFDMRDTDSDGDTLPDGVEAGHNNAQPDGTVPGPYGTNGLADSVETLGGSGEINYTVLDTDMDGNPNFQDVDSDGDGVDDNTDVFPTDPTETEDMDMDGVGDNGDNCPATPNPGQEDADNDGIGDACEPDQDADGVIDDIDNCVMTANPGQEDADNDGIGNACEPDQDADGVIDDIDNCVMTANPGQEDTDADGLGSACDNCPTAANPGQEDTDADGIGNTCDNCPAAANPGQEDTDADGTGNACEPDQDMDGVIDDIDNCVMTANPGQEDTDADGTGNACEPDQDMDGVIDDIDNCVMTANPGQEDTDADGTGNACEPDQDMDGVIDDIDNCVMTANPGQEDTDADGTGNACEPDSDGDGIPDDTDNCPNDANADQADKDADGVGDACEPDRDGDGIPDDTDNCPDDANADQTDSDADGTGDACDTPTTDDTYHGEGSSFICDCRQAMGQTRGGSVPVALGALLALGLVHRRRASRRGSKTRG